MGVQQVEEKVVAAGVSGEGLKPTVVVLSLFVLQIKPKIQKEKHIRGIQTLGESVIRSVR